MARLWCLVVAVAGRSSGLVASPWRAEASAKRWSALQDGEMRVEEVRVEDRDVPEAHRGLHEMLYGAGEEHGVAARSGAAEDGRRTYDAAVWAAACDRKVTGVYTMRDASGEVVFVGVSRDVASAIRSHVKRAGPERAATVRIVEKTTLARREELEAMRAKVLAALPRVPEGNRGEPGSLWVETAADATRDDETKRQVYDDSKSKLMAAMAETPTEASGALRAAIESDDWSAVVDGGVVSPFATGQVEVATPETVFSKAAVDRVLDSIRPALVADGGNVRVVSVDDADKSVVLQLEGACGSCGSASVTMENGIERALRQAWPDLGTVSRLDDQTRRLTAALAESLLDPIRDAFTKLGATATVLNANLLGPGVVELAFTGPETVRYGIELSLLDSPMVNEVRWYLEDDAAPADSTT